MQPEEKVLILARNNGPLILKPGMKGTNWSFAFNDSVICFAACSIGFSNQYHLLARVPVFKIDSA
jgi:hypothetical protein